MSGLRGKESFGVQVEKATSKAILGIEVMLGLKERINTRIGISRVIEFEIARVGKIKSTLVLQGQPS